MTLTLLTLMGFTSSYVDGATGYSYLNDAEPRPNTNTRHLFPRVVLTETKALSGDLDRYAKYYIISTQGGLINKVAELQNRHPELTYFRHFSPRAYQGYESRQHCNGGNGMPFEGTTAVTEGCNVFAGHWLYSAGTSLLQGVDAGARTLKVRDAGKIGVGQYVVIYDAPAGSFRNAEHAKVVGRNTSTGTITLESRGYKSTPKAHPSGAIVASHVVGQIGDARNWSYNLSSTGPRDANGKTTAEVMANWLANNYNRDGSGNRANIKVSGILFDADFSFELSSKRSDVDNNLAIDDGISSNGQNLWGQGLERLYGLVRARLPGFSIVGGTNDSRGASLSGTQMEGFPLLTGFLNRNPNYEAVDALLADYSYHVRHGAGPLHTHNLSKTPTKSYPNGTGASSNAPFRFALGLTLLEDGYYGQENSERHPDPWYDEYAVDVASGQAVASNPYDESAILQRRGWLGKPLGVRYRLYDTAAFAPNRALVSATFDGGTSGWSGRNVNVSRTSTALEGSGALAASGHLRYDRDIYATSIQGPSVSLTRGTSYTLAFAAKASQVREVKASAGSEGQRFLVGTGWRRYVMTWTAPATGKYPILFGVGRENTQVMIDSVYLFAGDADVFRRDFERGIVVVNATSKAKAVNLGGTFQRIKGRQDPAVNNGAVVSQVTIPPHDAAILVRRPGGR